MENDTETLDVRDRLMEAATALLGGSGNIDSTVQEIAALARVSTKTFYRHFADKDDFFYQYWMRRLETVAERVRAHATAQTDPVERLRAFATSIFESTDAASASGGSAWFHLRVAQTTPDKIAVGHRPLYDLLVTLIEDAQQAGRVAAGEATRLATPMLELLTVSARDQRIGSSVTPTVPSVDDTVEFCLRGLGATAV